MAIRNFYIYSNCDFSQTSAATTRMLYYAKALTISKKNQVYLVSCCSNQIVDKDFKEIAPNTYLHQNKALTKRPIKTLRFLIELNRFSENKKGENIFILYPYPLIFLELLTVPILIWSKKKPVYFELNEVRKYSSMFHEPFSYRKLKYSIKKLIYPSLYSLIDYSMRFYDGVVCISSNIEKYGKSYNSNTLRIPILTDSNHRTSTSGAKEKKYAVKNAFNIGFSGTIHPSKENLIDFIDVLVDLKKQGLEIVFNLCGSVENEHYQSLFENSPMGKNIVYHGNLDRMRLSHFLKDQNLLVLPRGYTKQNNFGFSTKLSDYFNHKKITLTTDISDNGIYIKDGINGFIVPPNDKKALYEKLFYIIKNFTRIESSMTEEVLIASQANFDYRLYSGSLNNFLKSKREH